MASLVQPAISKLNGLNTVSPHGRPRNPEEVRFQVISDYLHDLRTPLVALRGYSRMVLEERAERAEELTQQVPMGHDRTVARRAGQHETVPAGERQEHRRDEEQGNGPGHGDIARAGDERDGGG